MAKFVQIPRRIQQVMKNLLTSVFVKAREDSRGQTMTEYALILSGIALAVFVSYKAMGCNIRAVLGAIDGQL